MADTIKSVRPDTEAWSAAKREFLDAQANQCAICLRGLTEQTARLDHCHQTGFIRGVLCDSCNTKLGFYETRREAIERYLATAAEFAAYVVPSRISRTDRWRQYWQNKDVA